MAGMRLLFAIAARGIFWVLALYIVGSSAHFSWTHGEPLFAVLKFAFFPATYILSPWFHGQVGLLLISWLAYVGSTLIGGMRPVD